MAKTLTFASDTIWALENIYLHLGGNHGMKRKTNFDISYFDKISSNMLHFRIINATFTFASKQNCGHCVLDLDG